MKGTPDHQNNTTQVLILLSGGMDSAACVNFYFEKAYHVEAIHFDYGQAAAKMEFISAQAIAKHYSICLHHHCLSNANKKQVGQILGRNAFLLFAGLLEFPWDSGLLALGIHAGTPYFDCAKSFTEKAQSIFDGYSDGRIRISAPFMLWQKPRIWNYCLNENVPVMQTYSCEFGSPKPCGKCKSCKDMEALRG